jgi:hypothetical protein
MCCCQNTPSQYKPSQYNLLCTFSVHNTNVTQNVLLSEHTISVQFVTFVQCVRRHLESKERFTFKKLFIDNRKEKEYAGFITHFRLLLHIVTLDTEALVVPWHQFTYSLLVPEGRLAIQLVHRNQRAPILRYCKCLVTICTQVHETLPDIVRTLR